MDHKMSCSPNECGQKATIEHIDQNLDIVHEKVVVMGHRLQTVEVTQQEHHVTLYGKDNRPGLKDRVLIMGWESKLFYLLLGICVTLVADIIRELVVK